MKTVLFVTSQSIL